MLLAELLCSWVFTTTAAIAALQVPSLPQPNSSLLSRLDRLESLVADHQAQFQHERDQWQKENQQERYQWQKEKRILEEKLHLLQGDVHAQQKEKQEMKREMETLQNAQTMTQTLAEALHDTQTLTQKLAAENQVLKDQLGDLQRQLVSLDRKQQSLQDLVTRRDGKARPDTAGEEELSEEDQHAAGEQSGQAAHTSEHQGDFRQVNHSSPQHLGDSDPVWHLSDPEPFKQHVLSARSDDQGPLQVVVDHLAQQTTQLTSDIQALRTQHSGDVQALKSADAQQRQDIQAARDARGSTFVQWGSSTCTGSSELVYSGIVGGSHYTHSGAASNALCMSLSPSLATKTPNYHALLYSGEYETEDSHDDMDPVCAVCRSPHSSTMMVPGTNVCSAGWSLQYSGFLMAGDYRNIATSQFICVDSKLESVLGSNSNHDGYVLYYTKTRCGGLPCPPYQNDKAVTCAVCSK